MAERVKLLTLAGNSDGSHRPDAAGGDRRRGVTEFRFSQMQENVPVSDTDFRFTPPAGVTVVQGLPPI